MDANAIVVRNLEKKFGDFTAVDNISFSVRQGELFGFLGPNGAGKTTTINILSTLLRKTSGSARVAGFDVSSKRDDVRKSIGVVFQEPALDSKLTGRENLLFHAMMYGIPKEESEKRIKSVLELVELTEKANELVENYSGGMKRRLEIARGLIHRPKVLFLDEPTLGLDAQTRRHIWEYIKKLNMEHKVTIILTTHYMEEADYLCNRVAIIDNGKIVATGTPKKLKNVLGGDVISMEVRNGSDKLVSAFKSQKWVKTARKYDGCISISVSLGERRIPEIIRIAGRHKAEVLSISLKKPSLEEVFIHFTGRSIRDEAPSHREKMRQRMMGRQH